MSIAADLIDKRVVRRYLERGVIDRADFQTHLEQLPDCVGKCVQVTPETSHAEVSESAPSAQFATP